MKSISNVRPETFQKVGDGSYYYNHGLKEVPVQMDPTEAGEDPTPEETAFEYNSVRIYSYPTKNNVTQAVLRDYIDESEEFNLINRYNSFQIGISEDIEDRDNYEAYLLEVKRLKEMIQIDITAFEKEGLNG